MSIEIEKSILMCILRDTESKIDLKTLKRDYFIFCPEYYDKVIAFRLSGKPDDVALINQELGLEIAKYYIQFRGGPNLYGEYRRHLLFDYTENYRQTKKTMTLKDYRYLADTLAPLAINDPNVYDLNKNLTDYTTELDNRIAGNIDWTPWGIDFLDEELGKLRMGKFIVIKGMRKFGKTTLATKMFYSFVSRNIPGIFISTEMGYFEIVDKIVSLNTQINSFKILNGNLVMPEDMNKISKALVEKISNKPGKILICSNLSMEYIKDKIEETKAKIIFIDYLQMLSIAEIPDGMSLPGVLESIAIKIKNLCLEKSVSVVGISQIDAESGGTKWCRAYEEKADTILWLKERPPKKNEQGKTIQPIETKENKEIRLNIVNRNGPSGDIDLIFKKQYGDFVKDVKYD